MKKGIRTEIDEEKLSNAVQGKTMHYPSILHLDEGDLKEIKDWKIGEEYEIELKVKMIKASSKGDFAPYNDSDKDEVHAEFEVVKAEYEEEKE